MFDGVRAANAHLSACGTPGTQAPSKACAHVHAEGSPLVLPREVVDAPQAHDQVASQSDQRCP
eukprot:8052890-Alexandrium_andersonii.AAC.1